jgi:hypothetical protein
MSFRCLITTLGQAKFAAALAGGTQVSVTHIAVGDGNGNATEPLLNQTALVREVHRTNISSITVNPADSSQVIFEGVVSSMVGGWTARELGLFDNTGAMIAVANIGSVYKPTVAEGSAREMVLRVIAQVNQVDAINLVIDPSFYIATRSWVQSNFSVAALLPGGTTGQILRKKSNASGDTEWTDPFSAQNITVNVVEEMQTLASGQTIVNLATANTQGIAVYVEGIRLRPNQFTVNTNIRFTLAQSYPAGSKILAVQNDPAAALDFLRKSLNFSELTDKPLARANLGLGSAAVKAEGDFIPSAQASTFVAKAGGTMTGPLVLSGSPSSELQAATKGYVDGTSVRTQSGYQILPSGIIIQWGTFVAAGNNTVGNPQFVSLPITFPNALTYAECSVDGAWSNGDERAHLDWQPGRTTQSRIAVYCNYYNGVVKFIAIGY